MRLRFWRKKPKTFSLGTHRIQVKGNPKNMTPEHLTAVMTELQSMSIVNLQNQVARYYDEVIGLRTQVRDLNNAVEKQKARIEKLEAKGK